MLWRSFKNLVQKRIRFKASRIEASPQIHQCDCYNIPFVWSSYAMLIVYVYNSDKCIEIKILKETLLYHSKQVLYF